MKPYGGSKWGIKYAPLFALLLLLLIVSIILSLAIGSADIPLTSVLKTLAGSEQQHETIVLRIRMPRVLMGALVGAGLSVAGAVMQGLFRNPLADPYITGTSTGAALGAALAMLFLPFYGLRPVMAFAGAMGATLLVYRISKVENRVPVTSLLLVGIAVSLFLSALLSLLMYLMREDVYGMVFWLMGGLEVDISRVYLIAIPLMISFIPVYIYSGDLNAILFGEETAHGLGVEVEAMKMRLLVLAALITALCVAFTGTLGFVGLIIPHITRTMVGPDHRILIPLSAIIGAIFLIWMDALSRTAGVPVGVLTALCGAPFFIYLLKRRSYGFGE